MIVNSFRSTEDTQPDQAELDTSYRDDVKNDETVDNESLNCEEIESDSDQIHVPLPTGQFKRSNRAGKRSVDGPSANRNEEQ